MLNGDADPSSAHSRRPDRQARGRARLVVALALIAAGCAQSARSPEDVPGRQAGEIAAASKAAAFYRRGIERFDAGRYRRAISSFRASIRHNSKDPRPYLEIGACYAQLGDAKRELVAYEEALVAAPDFAPAHNSRGVALLRLDRVDAAAGAFGQALKLEMEYAPAHINLAIAYSRLGEHELALLSIENAEQFGGPVFDVMSNKGLILVELERYREAIEAFDRALRARPGYLPVRFERAMTLARHDRPEEAILELERITTGRPEFARAYLEKARLLARIGRAPQALAQYDAYLSLAPADAQAWNELGNVYFALGRYERAEGCFRNAIRHRRDFHTAYLNYAACLDQLGRDREAERVRRRAERYKPQEAGQ